jgi:hypothetical protein
MYFQKTKQLCAKSVSQSNGDLRMRIFRQLALSVFAIMSLSSSSVFAGDAVQLGALTGGLLGKAVHCDYTELARLSAKAMKQNSKSVEDEMRAVAQFKLTAIMAAKLGPQGESCSEFKEGYDQALTSLRTNL